MPYLTGKDAKVFISTENKLYGISQSGNVLSAVSWSAGVSLISHFVIPPLRTGSWAGTEADVTGSEPARALEVLSLEGLDLRPEHENEDIDFLGRTITDHIRIRKMGEAIVTRKMDTNAFALVYGAANAGVTGSGLNEAKAQTVTDSGFRVYCRISSGTGSDHTWVTFRNLQFTKEEIRPTPSRTTVEALTFQGNLWDIQQTPYSTLTSASEL